jgi:hypothetical protein
MRVGTLVGLILIVLGVLGLIYQGITYTRRRETVSLGPIQATAEQKETIPVSPILSGIAIVAGVALVVAVRRAR